MKSKHTHGRILMTFLGTYIPLILLGICAVFGVFYSLSKSLQQEINQQYYSNTVKIQLQLDQALKTIRQRSFALKWDSRLTTLSREDAPLDADSIYSLYEIIRDLKSRSTLEAATPSTTLLYFFNTDSIVSASGRCSSYSYYCNNAAKYGMTLEEWELLLTEGTHGQFQSWTRQRNGIPESGLFWTEPVVVAGNKTMTVVAFVELNGLVRMQTEPLLGNSSDFALLKEDGTFLYASLGAEFPTHLQDSFSDTDIYRIETATGRMALVVQKMQMQDWVCVSMVPLSILYQNLQKAYPLMLAVTVGLILSGVILIFYALKHHYRPIKRLQKLISSQTEESDRNEYRMIESALVNMMDTNQKILDTMQRQEQVIRQNFLLELLVQGDKQLKEEQLSLCPKLSQGSVLLAGFFRTEAEAEAQINTALQELTSAAVLSCAYTATVDSSIFCLIGLPSDRISTRLMSTFSQLLTCIRQQSPQAFCTISSHKNSWKQFPQAYNEVLISGDLFAKISPDRPIPYSQAKKKISQEYRRILSPSMQKHFASLLQLRDFDGAETFINEFCLQLQGEEGLSLYIGKSRAFSLLNEAFHSLDADGAISQSLRREQDWPGRILCVNSFSGLRTAMLECISILRQIDQEEPQKSSDRSHTTQTVEAIRAYIEANFRNPDLSVSNIADEFHLSLSYLSKIFKEGTGQGVLDYINSTRVTYAKELLRQTGKSVKSIGEAAGFYNSNAFIRCLKKYEGLTPGQYREKMAGQQTDS